MRHPEIWVSYQCVRASVRIAFEIRGNMQGGENESHILLLIYHKIHILSSTFIVDTKYD
jgi:hypothetical protein